MILKLKSKQPNLERQARSSAKSKQQTLYTYHASKQRLSSDSERQADMIKQRQSNRHGLNFKRFQMILSIVLIIALIAFWSWLSNVPKISVVGVTPVTFKLKDLNIYQESAEKILGKSLLSHDKLLINTTNLATQLEKQYPELANVTVNVPLIGDIPNIVLQPAAPVIRLSTTSGTTFLLSVSGKALATINQTPNTTMPVVTDLSGLPVHIGTVALPSGDISFIQVVVSQLQAHSISIIRMTLPQDSEELDVYISGKPYFIKFSLEDDVNQQVGTYLAVNNYLLQHNVTPGQYIDVRALGRAFYK